MAAAEENAEAGTIRFFTLDREEKWHIVGGHYMRLYRLVFFAVCLAVLILGGRATKLLTDERSANPAVAVHVENDTSTREESPISPKRHLLTKHLTQRRIDTFSLPLVAPGVRTYVRDVPPGCPRPSPAAVYAQAVSLHQILRVYRV